MMAEGRAALRLTPISGVIRELEGKEWPTTHVINVDKHGGFEPRRFRVAFTEAPAARNTVRHQC